MKKTFFLITLLFATMFASQGFAQGEYTDRLKNELGATTGVIQTIYVIEKAHRGELSVGLPEEKVETKEAQGNEFIILLSL